MSSKAHPSLLESLLLQFTVGRMHPYTPARDDTTTMPRKGHITLVSKKISQSNLSNWQHVLDFSYIVWKPIASSSHLPLPASQEWNTEWQMCSKHESEDITNMLARWTMSSFTSILTSSCSGYDKGSRRRTTSSPPALRYPAELGRQTCITLLLMSL